MTEEIEPLKPEDFLSKYITLKAGEEVTISFLKENVVKKKETKFKLTNEDYAIEIATTNGRIMSINAWVLWNKIRPYLQKAVETNNPNPLTLKIKRGLKKGEYFVEEVK